jgi:hypothetical protein
MAKFEHFLLRAIFDIPILVEVDIALSTNRERPKYSRMNNLMPYLHR